MRYLLFISLLVACNTPIEPAIGSSESVELQSTEVYATEFVVNRVDIKKQNNKTSATIYGEGIGIFMSASDYCVNLARDSINHQRLLWFRTFQEPRKIGGRDFFTFLGKAEDHFDCNLVDL